MKPLSILLVTSLLSVSSGVNAWWFEDNDNRYYGNSDYRSNENAASRMMNDMIGDMEMDMDMRFKVRGKGRGQGNSDGNWDNSYYNYYDNSYQNYNYGYSPEQYRAYPYGNQQAVPQYPAQQPMAPAGQNPWRGY